MVFQLIDKKSKKSFGSLQINLLDPDSVYDLGNGYKVEVASYLPDFYFNQDGEPSTKTKIPNNPAFVFNIITPDKPKGEKALLPFKKQLKGRAAISTS